ncbi:MAG: type II toxin-antitoxin system RelE/ParE family toxin [Burkholderiaceae bacterium]|nr:type II toxin-antitoxin system RelE/ParE family toxin [Burkholderiaceae bacterium]
MTVKPVLRVARADLDVLEAIDHYLEEAPHAVEAFVDALDETYGRIARDPGLGSPRYAHELDLPGLRHWRCRKFPYLVFYREADDCILILRVLHGLRDIPQRMRDAD